MADTPQLATQFRHLSLHHNITCSQSLPSTPACLGLVSHLPHIRSKRTLGWMGPTTGGTPLNCYGGVGGWHRPTGTLAHQINCARGRSKCATVCRLSQHGGVWILFPAERLHMHTAKHRDVVRALLGPAQVQKQIRAASTARASRPPTAARHLVAHNQNALTAVPLQHKLLEAPLPSHVKEHMHNEMQWHVHTRVHELHAAMASPVINAFLTYRMRRIQCTIFTAMSALPGQKDRKRPAGSCPKKIQQLLRCQHLMH